MDESNRLATTAIAIALTALIVTLGQFIQQLLGTADGYRRCKESVIGPWSKLTRLHGLWYEFRFETLYTSPEIALISFDNMDYKEMKERSRKLGMMQPIVRNVTLAANLTCLERNLHRRYSHSVWAYLPSFGAYLKSTFRYLLYFAMRKSQPKVEDTENGSESKVTTQLPSIHLIRERQIRKASEVVKKTVCDQPAEQELLVSWVPFLKALHENYLQQWPDDCECSTKGKSSVVSHFSRISEKYVESRWNDAIPGRTMPMLFLRERSWDFMPPDVVRPVASIQVRALIVLATRLGMQWSGLDLRSDGGMSAQGNSYHLTSVSLRGLGIVMQFGSNGLTARELGYIPSVAADKLLCGILPGCPGLCQEVKVVGDDRTQSLIGNFFDILGLPDDVYQSLADSKYGNRLGFRENVFRRMVINDAMILFCPFLPENLCTSVYCYFYAWSGQSQMSTFHLWESRRALLVQLRKRIKALNELPKDDNRLGYVKESLERLEKDFKKDFYVQRGSLIARFETDEERAASRKRGLEEVRLQRKVFLEDLREIFKVTQDFFLRRRLPNSENVKKVSEYVDLVSVNIEMCHFAEQKARKRCDTNDGKHPLNFSERPWEDFLECYEAASCYVEFLDHNEYELFVSLRRKRCKMENLKMKEAWWMLMLRDIVWNLSCNCLNSDEPIPSSFYDNQRPVWIMW